MRRRAGSKHFKCRERHCIEIENALYNIKVPLRACEINRACGLKASPRLYPPLSKNNNLIAPVVADDKPLVLLFYSYSALEKPRFNRRRWPKRELAEIVTASCERRVRAAGRLKTQSCPRLE